MQWVSVFDTRETLELVFGGKIQGEQMALDKDYCFTCKKEVTAKNRCCPECKKALWTAMATSPNAYKHKTRTKSYAVKELLQPAEHEEPWKWTRGATGDRPNGK